MDSAAMLWLERAIIGIEFISFLLVTPEILEEERLKAIERWLIRKIEHGAPSIITYISIVLALALALAILGIVFEIFHVSLDAVLPPFAQVALPLFFLLSMASGAMLGKSVTRKVLIPRLQKLAYDKNVRHRWCMAGGALFVVAKFVQLFATFFR
jgi:hypothetical protein